MYTYSAARRLWDAMHRACRAVEEQVDGHLAVHGVTKTEFGVLEELLRQGALPIGGLGQRVGLTSGSMTYLVDKLERRGWIRRRTGLEDRRVVYAELTGEGRIFVSTLLPPYETLIAEQVEVLDPHEQDLLIALAERISGSARLSPAHHPEGLSA